MSGMGGCPGSGFVPNPAQTFLETGCAALRSRGTFNDSAGSLAAAWSEHEKGTVIIGGSPPPGGGYGLPASSEYSRTPPLAADCMPLVRRY